MAKNPSTALWSSHRRTVQSLALLICACAGPSFAQTPADPENPPVWIGFDDAFGIKTNTSARAIEWGIQAAMEEINANGGVLNGRPLKLMTTVLTADSFVTRKKHLKIAPAQRSDFGLGLTKLSRSERP